MFPGAYGLVGDQGSVGLDASYTDNTGDIVP